MAENNYERGPPPVPPRNEANDPTNNKTYFDEDLYEDIDYPRGSQDDQHCGTFKPSPEYQRFAPSDNSSRSEYYTASEFEETSPGFYNTANDKSQFYNQGESFDYEDYVDCNQARRNVPYHQEYSYEYPEVATNETFKKIRNFKAKPREYLETFECKNDEMLSYEEAFIIANLLKKDTRFSVLEGRLDQLAMLACCKSPHVVKRALDALLNEIFLSISDFSRIRCSYILEAEEIIRDSFPKFLKADHFKAKCHRMTTYAWLIALVLLKCSKDELEKIQSKLREFDKTLNVLLKDRENTERTLFRYGIQVARESIKQIVQSCGRRDSREGLLQNIKKCENILNSNLEENEVMKLANEIRNAGSWLDLHVCLIFLQDLPKFFQFRGNRKPVILIQLLIANYRDYCSSIKAKLSRTTSYKKRFEILVYRVMLRLIRTSPDKAITDQVLNGEQGCGGILKSWMQNKTDELNDELVGKYLNKLCQKAVFYAEEPSIFQQFLADHCDGDGTEFIENLLILRLSSVYKEKVLEIFSESRICPGQFGVVSYDASMNGKKCLLKLHQHSREDVLGSSVMKSVPLQEEIKILKILTEAVEPSPYIVQLLASSDETPMHMIIERAPAGDLLTYLRGIKSSLDTKDLLKIAQDVCDAMIYLGENKIIHRDLRASNCFVFMEDEKIRLTKLGDFRLAIWYHPPKLPVRQDGRQNFVQSKVIDDLPKNFAIRWTAVEALRFSDFSSASDLWSFGVLLSEIFTLGAKPYINMPSGLSLERDESVREFVCEGNRLELHPKIPESIQDLITLTMVEKDHRPTFARLKVFLLEVNFKKDLYQVPTFFKMKCHTGSADVRPTKNPPTDCNVTGCFGECLNGSDIATPFNVKGRPGHHIMEFIDVLNISSDTFKVLDLHHSSLAKVADKIIHAKKMEMITEVGDLGNLEEFIPLYGCSIENSERYTLQIAEAMSFLHSRRFIHRNLRATSVFIYSSGNAKLACFARMRKLRPNPEEYSSTTPVTLSMPDDSLRWSSPEVISRGEYNKPSDIWAFAIMIWEMFTLIDKENEKDGDKISHLPYHPLETKKQILSYLEKERLRKPNSCPDWLFNLMLNCWKYDAKDRLKCDHIVECIMNQKPSTPNETDAGNENH